MSEPVVITKVEDGWIGGAIKGFLWHSGQIPGSDSLAIFTEAIVRDAKRFCASQEPVLLFLEQAGRGKASVLRIKPFVTPESFIIVGRDFRHLELSPYHQRWYWCATSRYATPLTRAAADAPCEHIRLEPVHDADADHLARVVPDHAQRTPQIIPELPPLAQQRSA